MSGQNEKKFKNREAPFSTRVKLREKDSGVEKIYYLTSYDADPDSAPFEQGTPLDANTFNNWTELLEQLVDDLSSQKTAAAVSILSTNVNTDMTNFQNAISANVNYLADQIVSKVGTKVTVNNAYVLDFEAGKLISEDDIINIDGGQA